MMSTILDQQKLLLNNKKITPEEALATAYDIGSIELAELAIQHAEGRSISISEKNVATGFHHKSIIKKELSFIEFLLSKKVLSAELVAQQAIRANIYEYKVNSYAIDEVLKVAQLELIKLVLSQSEYKDSRNINSLLGQVFAEYYIPESQKLEIVKILVAHGADLNLLQHWQVARASTEILEFIVAHGYSVQNLIDCLFNINMGWDVNTLKSPNFIEKANFICDLVLKIIPDLSSVKGDKFYASPPIGVVQRLLDHGLNPEITLSKAFRDYNYITYYDASGPVIDPSIVEYQQELVEISLLHGANISNIDISDRAIHSPKLVQLLLEKGVNPNQFWHSILLPFGNYDSNQPCSSHAKQAINSIAFEIMTLILERGANPEFIMPALVGIESAQCIEKNDLKTKLDFLNLDFNTYFNKVVDISEYLQNYGVSSAMILDILAICGEKTSFLHLFAFADSIDVMKFLVSQYGLKPDVNLKNSQGQTALFAVKSAEFYNYLCELGIDNDALDNQGNYWYEHAPKQLVLAALAKGEILPERYEAMIKNFYIKGDFYVASNLYDKGAVEMNFENIVTAAIITGIKASVEPFKYQALIHIFDKHNIYLPQELVAFKNTPHKTLESIKDILLTPEVLKPLSAYFLKLAKSKLIADISNENGYCDLNTVAIINDIFATNGKDGFAKFQILKGMFPFNKILSGIQNAFGAIHKTLGLAINLLDEDHGLEVLAMSSLAPTAHEQDIMVYRGIAGEVDDAFIAFIFDNGYRTESSFNSDHYLFGYYVDNGEFTWKDIAADDASYNFGGTYVSISPSQAYNYAIGFGAGKYNGGVLLEMRQKPGEAKICGTHSDELIPSRIDAHNIKAIYRIDADKLISAVYLNPNYTPAANEPNLTYKVGDNSSTYAHNYNIYGINDFYAHIKCATELNPVHRYASTDEFKAKFDANALVQARAKMYADLEDTLDICLIPESNFNANYE